MYQSTAALQTIRATLTYTGFLVHVVTGECQLELTGISPFIGAQRIRRFPDGWSPIRK